MGGIGYLASSKERHFVASSTSEVALVRLVVLTSSTLSA
jgi:hypothetical protein